MAKPMTVGELLEILGKLPKEAFVVQASAKKGLCDLLVVKLMPGVLNCHNKTLYVGPHDAVVNLGYEPDEASAPLAVFGWSTLVTKESLSVTKELNDNEVREIYNNLSSDME